MTRALATSLIATVLLAAPAWAQSSPVGLWKTIDDDGKTEKSLVRISESNGVLVGNIEKIFDPTHQDSKCDLCKDDRKDKPVLGLQIIRGVKHDADDKALWTGGEILDPNNGKTYRTRLKPIEGGKKLEMRGYVGFFYRTQVWVRVE
ncbi:DUF2147 domain-containing protein [Roseateles sp. DB2]|uniref:DUF2147 domain-containing protein n=1 Tax=Roseateles sp. DB2 TaxID=3453717 RepID=UPI003EECD6D1